MPKSVHIAAPRPTLEERAKRLRIPKARQKELQVFVDAFMAQHSLQEEVPAASIKPEKRPKRASAA